MGPQELKMKGEEDRDSGEVLEKNAYRLVVLKYEGLQKQQLLGPCLDFDLGGAQECAFLTGSLVTLMLLVQEPHIVKHWVRPPLGEMLPCGE